MAQSVKDVECRNNEIKKQRRGKGRGKNASVKQRGRSECKSEKFPTTIQHSSTNDPQWYFKDKRILEDTASYSFNQPLGTRLHFNQYHLPTGLDTNKIGASAVPGLMTVRLALTPGIAVSAEDPVNIAATNVYSYVRYKNSGSANYDAPDLMMYLLAMDSLYACWNWMQRIYGFASIYSQTNKYLPRAYMEANNVDFDDVMAHLADFRAWLNVKAQSISAFCVPATMTYNIRHSWLFSNIFKDSDTNKAQQYMYVPAWFYKYDETSSPKGGQLVPVIAVPNTVGTAKKYKVTDLMNMLNSMIEAVNYAEDIGIMSGDILKAYGAGNLFTLSPIDPDYKVEAVHSPEVLWQIENMHCLFAGSTDISQFNITQDPNTNFIKYNPELTGVVAPRNGGYLNFHHNDITAENVIVASRLLAATVTKTGTQNTTITSCGSEIALNAYLSVFVENANTSATLTDSTQLQLIIKEIPFVTYPELKNGLVDVETLNEYLTIIGWYSAFDWAPELLLGVGYTDAESHLNHSTVGVIRDWDKYTLLDNQDIESMNLLALLTEFNVPN